MAPTNPPDNVINLPTGDALKKQLAPKPEQPEPQPEQEAPVDPRDAFLNDLIGSLQAMQALQENKTHTIRTKELDIEKAQSARLINQFLSRNAADALLAMEFMHLIMPQMVGNIAAIFAQHRMTHMPLVDALNGIAKAKRQAMEQAKAQKEGGADEEKHRSEED